MRQTANAVTVLAVTTHDLIDARRLARNLVSGKPSGGCREDGLSVCLRDEAADGDASVANVTLGNCGGIPIRYEGLPGIKASA